MFNWAVYSFNMNKVVQPLEEKDNVTSNGGSSEEEHFVSFTELLIPMSLSLLLSMIHSQIVATASSTISSNKKKRLPQPAHRRKRERSTKRRKKPARVRTTSAVPAIGTTGETKPLQKNTMDSFTDKNAIGDVCDRAQIGDQSEDALCSNYKCRLELDNHSINRISSNNELKIGRNASNSKCNDDADLIIVKIGKAENVSILTSTINLDQNCSTKNVQLVVPSKELRRRNVNWDSPIKSHEIVHRQYHSSISEEGNEAGGSYVFEVAERNDGAKASAHDDGSPGSADELNDLDGDFGANNQNVADQTAGDDDGFESLNGKSSSGEENGNLNGVADGDPVINDIERPVQYSRGKDAAVVDPADGEGASAPNGINNGITNVSKFYFTDNFLQFDLTDLMFFVFSRMKKFSIRNQAVYFRRTRAVTSGITYKPLSSLAENWIAATPTKRVMMGNQCHRPIRHTTPRPQHRPPNGLESRPTVRIAAIAPPILTIIPTRKLNAQKVAPLSTIILRHR